MMLGTILTILVAAIHFYFLYLEMFKWEAPRTRKAFGMTEELASQTVVMAANQGLYNGFLGAGLLIGLVTGNASMVVFLLCCVIVAGLYALYCGLRAALFAQSLPAIAALIAVWMAL